MSIIKASKIGTAVCLLCLGILIACAVLAISGISDMEKANHKRFESTLLAQEVRGTSSGLTANARAYVSTADKVYEDAYWNLVKIRSGEMSRPADAAVAPGFTIPMGTLLINAGFTEEELALLEESVKISSDLVLLEDEAMNAVKGLFQDNSGKYTVKKAPDPELARRLMFGKDYDATVRHIMEPSYKFDSLVAKRLNAESAAVKHSLDRAIVALCVSVAIMGVLLLAGISMLLRKVMAPIRASTVYAQAVAEGNLDAPSPRFDTTTNNEIGAMISSMKKMVTNLKERILHAEEMAAMAEEHGRKADTAMQDALEAKNQAESGQQTLLSIAGTVDEMARRLFSATENLATQVRDSERSAEQQQGGVASSLTSMEQMNDAVLEIAQNTGVAAEEADKTKVLAANGESVMRQSVDSINTVQQDTRELKERMNELGKQAEAIGAIMVVISDIADQTNLLALNAAIEAARAGEAGRGFAVVADEVRKLAEKTMGATTEVGQAIKNIQNEARSSIATVEHTADGLDKATELVGKSGDALKDLVQGISQTAFQISGIATAAEEQSATSEQITKTLQEINQQAERTTSAMLHASRAINEIIGLSRDLQTNVEKLRGQ
ncbi:MAG: methyl-accepting chemotaxis protein [Desulfovibrionaceae bacterium]|nr:methyl-accepting chemotaxis protein [Desulfovibrionaceae bacterium]